eukprot:324334-Chlamydomonas_euryale.AAC.3
MLLPHPSSRASKTNVKQARPAVVSSRKRNHAFGMDRARSVRDACGVRWCDRARRAATGEAEKAAPARQVERGLLLERGVIREGAPAARRRCRRGCLCRTRRGRYERPRDLSQHGSSGGRRGGGRGAAGSLWSGVGGCWVVWSEKGLTCQIGALKRDEGRARQPYNLYAPHHLAPPFYPEDGYLRAIRRPARAFAQRYAAACLCASLALRGTSRLYCSIDVPPVMQRNFRTPRIVLLSSPSDPRRPARNKLVLHRPGQQLPCTPTPCTHLRCTDSTEPGLPLLDRNAGLGMEEQVESSRSWTAPTFSAHGVRVRVRVKVTGSGSMKVCLCSVQQDRGGQTAGWALSRRECHCARS